MPRGGEEGGFHRVSCTVLGVNTEKEDGMKRILLALGAILLCMLVLPLIFLHSAKGRDAMGYAILLFLVIYPALAVGLGILAGTDVKRLWWLPVANALFFPPFLWISLDGAVWELYLYSAIYLGLSVVSAVPTALIRHAVALKKK